LVVLASIHPRWLFNTAQAAAADHQQGEAQMLATALYDGTRERGSNENAVVRIDQHCRFSPLELPARTKRPPERELLQEDVGAGASASSARQPIHRYPPRPPNAI
jgi:hypothetical protein